MTDAFDNFETQFRNLDAAIDATAKRGGKLKPNYAVTHTGCAINLTNLLTTLKALQPLCSGQLRQSLEQNIRDIEKAMR